MRITIRPWLLTLLVTVLLGGCHAKTAALPNPLEPTADSVSHFCGMLVLEHFGPKGQIFLKRKTAPVWFSSVSEAIAYTMLPDEPADIVAIYVNDLGKAKNWKRPEPGTWVEARRAWYVLDSNKRVASGMGDDRREPIPFSDQPAAQKFQKTYGGRIVRFAEIPQDEIRGSGATEGRNTNAQSAAPAAQPN